LVKDRSGNIATAVKDIEIARGQGGGLPAADFSRPIANRNLFGQNVSMSKQYPATNNAAPGYPKTAASNTSSVPAYSQAASDTVLPAVLKNAKIVNSLRFQLNYKVEEVGPSGVGKVEFYVTEDQGKQWFRYGDDADRTSPFTLQVPKDGTYGFDLRVHSGAGLASPPPQPGDKPAIMVVVDQTLPEIILEKPQVGFNGMLNQVLIKWKLNEAYPAAQPISLSYATSAIGPWLPIGSWQADQGQYIWEVNEHMPAEVFFKVTAKDRAGNVGVAQTEEPIMIDLSRPSARIVNVEALPVQSGDDSTNAQ